jgi:Ni/Co efflux regulator RcnB
MLLPAGEPERMSPRTCTPVTFAARPLPNPCQVLVASYTEAVVVQELISGAMAAADAAAAAAAVAADSEAARRKERAKHKRQRKRHRDRGSHNQRTNKRKNLRRSEGRKARARTRAQMAPVLSQLSHLTRSRLAVEPRLSKQARPPSRMPSDADLYTCMSTCACAR